MDGMSLDVSSLLILHYRGNKSMVYSFSVETADNLR